MTKMGIPSGRDAQSAGRSGRAVRRLGMRPLLAASLALSVVAVLVSPAPAGADTTVQGPFLAAGSAVSSASDAVVAARSGAAVDVIGGLPAPAGAGAAAWTSAEIDVRAHLQQGGFGDLAEGAFYSTAVSALAAQGVFEGTDCGEGFCPDEPIDRETMAVWTVRVVDGVDPPAGTGGRFDDVDPDSFYAPFTERMAQLRITLGCGDGTGFCPADAVTRAQMAVFLSRAFNLTDGPASGFADVADDAWYATEVARLAASGITRGCGDGTRFCPGQPTTRAQMATFLYRGLQFVADREVAAMEASHIELSTVPGEATVVPHRGRASVSWPPAEALPGSPVAGYEVQWRAQGQAWDATRRAVVVAQSYEIYGLSGETHHVRVRRAIVERAEAAGASITSAQGTAPTAELVTPPAVFDEASSISAYDGVVNFEMTGDPVWPATIEIPVDTTKIDDGDFIFLMSFNEEHQLWLPEPGAVFDPEAGVVTAEVYHLSIWDTAKKGLRGLNKGVDFVKEVGRDALDTATITAEIVVKPVVNAGHKAIRFGYDKAKDVVYWTEETLEKTITYSMKAFKMSAEIALETARQYWEHMKLMSAVPQIVSMVTEWYERNVEFKTPDCADSELEWVERVYIPTADSPMIVCGEADSGDLLLKVASQRYYPIVLTAHNASGRISISKDTTDPIRVEKTEGASDLSEVLIEWLLDISDDSRYVLPVSATHWLRIPQSALGRHDSMTLEGEWLALAHTFDLLLLAVDLLLTPSGIPASSSDASLLIGLGDEVAECLSQDDLTGLGNEPGLGNELQRWRTFSEALYCVHTAIQRAGVLKGSVSLLGPFALVLWFLEAGSQLTGFIQAGNDLRTGNDNPRVRIEAEPSDDSTESEDPSSSTSKFKAVSAFYAHSCGLRTDGTIVCWGEDDFGKLDAPGGHFRAVSVGLGHSCGLRTDGTIVCWGSRADAPGGSFEAISAGGRNSCGLRTDGTIVCWGSRDYGVLNAPAGSFRAVSAGGGYSCGLRTDGTIVCWGINDQGRLDAPPGSFKAVSAGGGQHSCGLQTDDTIVCWGNNTNGELDDVPAGSFRAVSAGGGYSCGLRTDGTIVCWGSNVHGQLDAPSGNFSAVSAGAGHSCGLRIDGTIVCWGWNSSGQSDAP